MTEKYRQLPVKLTEQEVKERWLRLGSMLDEEDAIEKRRRDAVNTANEELKDVRATTIALRQVVRSGVELRDVAIEERKDLSRRVLEVIRLDTMDIIDSRHLSIEETQTDLPFNREQGERHTSYSAKDGADVVPMSRTRDKLEEVSAPSSPTSGGASSSKRRRKNVPEPERASNTAVEEQPQEEAAPLDTE